MNRATTPLPRPGSSARIPAGPRTHRAPEGALAALCEAYRAYLMQRRTGEAAWTEWRTAAATRDAQVILALIHSALNREYWHGTPPLGVEIAAVEAMIASYWGYRQAWHGTEGGEEWELEEADGETYRDLRELMAGHR